MTKYGGIWELAAVYVSLVGWVFGEDCTIGDDVEEGAISRLTLEFMASTSSRISRIIVPKLSSKRSSL